jgi:hypothetical protein
MAQRPSLKPQVFAMRSTHRIIVGAAALAGSLLTLGACTTLPVTTDSNPGASVGSCRTYAFAQEHVANSGQQQNAFANPLNSDRLRAAIAANLASRGIEPVAAHTPPDCVVGYAMGSRVVADEYAGWGWGAGWGGYGYGWGWGGPRGWGGVGYYGAPVRNEGRITIDLFDAKSHSAIWHASVNQYVGDLTGPAADQKINQATAAIFMKFPVAAPTPAAAPAQT